MEDQEVAHENEYEGIIDDHQKVEEEIDQRVCVLKKKIMNMALFHPDYDFDSKKPELKKLDGKTVEELETILQDIEIMTDSSLLFQQPKAVLRLFIQTFSWFSITLSYERLSKKLSLLKYIDSQLPNVVGNWFAEFEIFAILMEELELSDADQKKLAVPNEEAA